MANETTSATQAALIATEVIASSAIEAHKPRNVLMQLCASDSNDGTGSNQKRYPKFSDLGVASGGSEGVDLTPTVALGMGTSVNVSPTEAIAEMALVTDDTVMRRLGGTPFQTVRAVFESGNKQAIAQLLAPDIRRLVAMGMQKLEADACALLSGISTSVGADNTDLGILAMLQAVWQMKKNQPLRPPSEWGFVLPDAAVHHLNVEAYATSGGLAGNLWGSGGAQFTLGNRPQDTFVENGLVGGFLQYPVYELDNEQKVVSGNNVLGAMACLSSLARSYNSYAGRPPWAVYLERHFINFAFQADESLRSMEIIMNARYAFAELVDLNAVSILADND